MSFFTHIKEVKVISSNDSGITFLAGIILNRQHIPFIQHMKYIFSFWVLHPILFSLQIVFREALMCMLEEVVMLCFYLDCMILRVVLIFYINSLSLTEKEALFYSHLMKSLHYFHSSYEEACDSHILPCLYSIMPMSIINPFCWL